MYFCVSNDCHIYHTLSSSLSPSLVKPWPGYLKVYASPISLLRHCCTPSTTSAHSGMLGQPLQSSQACKLLENGVCAMCVHDNHGTGDDREHQTDVQCTAHCQVLWLVSGDNKLKTIGEMPEGPWPSSSNAYAILVGGDVHYHYFVKSDLQGWKVSCGTEETLRERWQIVVLEIPIKYKDVKAFVKSHSIVTIDPLV